MFGSPSFEAAQAGPSDEDDGTPTAGLRSEPSSPLFLADDDDVDEDEDEEEEEGLLDSGSIPIPLFEDELSHASANGHILPHDIKGCLLVGSPSVQTAS